MSVRSTRNKKVLVIGASLLFVGVLAASLWYVGRAWWQWRGSYQSHVELHHLCACLTIESKESGIFPSTAADLNATLVKYGKGGLTIIRGKPGEQFAYLGGWSKDADPKTVLLVENPAGTPDGGAWVFRIDRSYDYLTGAALRDVLASAKDAQGMPLKFNR